MGIPRILLVNPKTVNKYYHVVQSPVDRLFSKFFRWSYDKRFDIPTHSHCTTMPPISLYALEALIGSRCDVQIVDEQVDEIPFDEDIDLVCITSTTPQISRAYQISSLFRNRGIPTAIGGVHATCLPNECQSFCTSVCVGEAEGYIDQMLQDLNNRRMARRYENRLSVSMNDTPFYRYELGGGKYLPFHVINFSRSCPFKCDFCSIQSTLGTFRTRTVSSVVNEIVRVGARDIWFPDATLTADVKRAKELFEALKPLKIRWLSQITLNMTRDRKLLDLMAESGCWLVSIGFESLSQRNVKTASKFQNKVEDYGQVIRELHNRNIAIEGNFVFGFDEDDGTAFDTTAQFVIDVGIDLPEFYVLTPYPDTQLFKRLKAENRIVDYNWAHYDNTHFHYLPVFLPKNMSREELRDGCRQAERKVYSISNSIRRLMNSRICRVPALMANYIYSSRIKSRHDLIPLSETVGEQVGMPGVLLDPLTNTEDHSTSVAPIKIRSLTSSPEPTKA